MTMNQLMKAIFCFEQENS
ncbi:hypothetical protein NXF25_015364 [Crotalus adamanteus]|uniref:Uncharacterized protein n=1 Tax=Crotalus adamanteus TaxID=8729 RepID=A0AAW1AZ92_CROAD